MDELPHEDLPNEQVPPLSQDILSKIRAAFPSASLAKTPALGSPESDDDLDTNSQLDSDEEVEVYEMALEDGITTQAPTQDEAVDAMDIEDEARICDEDILSKFLVRDLLTQQQTGGVKEQKAQAMEDELALIAQQLEQIAITTGPPGDDSHHSVDPTKAPDTLRSDNEKDADMQMDNIILSVHAITKRLTRLAIAEDPSSAPVRKRPGRRYGLNSISDDESTESDSLSEESESDNEDSMVSKDNVVKSQRSSIASSAEVSASSDSEFEVEAILKFKNDDDGKPIYFVKWKGYTDRHNSWVREEDAGNTQDLIKAFWKKKNATSPSHNDERPERETWSTSRMDGPLDVTDQLIHLDFHGLVYNKLVKLIICVQCSLGLPFGMVHDHLTTKTSVPIATDKVPAACKKETVVHTLKGPMASLTVFTAALKAVLKRHGVELAEVGDMRTPDAWTAHFQEFHRRFPDVAPRIEGLQIYMVRRCATCRRAYTSLNVYNKHFVRLPSGSRACSFSDEGKPIMLAQRAADKAKAAFRISKEAPPTLPAVISDIEDVSDVETNNKGKALPRTKRNGRKSQGKGAKGSNDEADTPDRPQRGTAMVPKGEDITAQSFTRAKNRQFYFEVDASTKDVGTIPGANLLSWETRLQANRARMREQAQKATDGVKKDTFVETEGIRGFLEPFDPAIVYSACHISLRGGGLGNRLRRRLASLRKGSSMNDVRTVQSFHSSVRFLFKDCSPRTRPGTDWKPNLSDTSLAIYTGVQEMMICAVATHVLKPILARNGKSALFCLTPVQEQATRNLIHSLHVDRTTALSKKETLIAIERMYAMLYSIYFPPSSTQFLKQSFSSPLVAFLATLWIKHDGTYIEIQEFTPYLAKVQFMMRLAGFHKMQESFEVVEQGERDEQADCSSTPPSRSGSPQSSLQQAADVCFSPKKPAEGSPDGAVADEDFLLRQEMKDLRPRRKSLHDFEQELENEGKTGSQRWFLFVKTWTATYLWEFMPTPFATLRGWMHTATHIVNRTTRRPIIVTTDDAGGTVQIGAATFTVDDFIAAIHRELELLLELIKQILMGVDLAEEGIQYNPYTIKDTMDEATPGYGIFNPLENEDSNKFFAALSKCGAFTKDGQPDQVDSAKIVEWLAVVDEAWKILYPLHHMLCGPVARGTEEGYYNIVNQTGGRRHVFYTTVQGAPLLLLRSDYHKNLKQTSLVKEIHRVCPHVLAEATWILIQLVRPVEAAFAAEYIIPPELFDKASVEYASGLYVSLGRRMDNITMSHCLKAFFERRLQCSIGLRLFRHLSIFIQRRELSKAPKDDKAKELVVAAEVMNGHTADTGERIYARLAQMGSGSGSLRDAQIKICLLMQRVYGVDSFPPPQSAKGLVKPTKQSPLLKQESSRKVTRPLKPRQGAVKQDKPSTYAGEVSKPARQLQRTRQRAQQG
ncbi:hypothetical protein PTI98_007177 [Pleurotus ostreatus]|nr:hypothetical protein PTI98_007177 [Pleurotus ostreatus]